MIWLLGLGLVIAVNLYLIAPFIAREVNSSPSAELSTYRDELRAIEQSEEPEAAKKAILQARLLKAARTESPLVSARTMIAPVFITLGLLGGGLGLYSQLGAPGFTPEIPQAAPELAATDPQGNEPTDLRTLLPRFEARLAENPNDATGWNLYGRTLMLVGDTDAGLRAYERALELSDTPDIRKEYEAAKTFAEQIEKGPSAEDIAAMENLSEEDRTAAIEGMVESLRARLENDPSDAKGWLQLLRSRKVLGQIEAGKADIEALRKALPPKQAEDIIALAGWGN